MSATLQEPPRTTEQPPPSRSPVDEVQLSPRALKRLQEREKLRTSQFDVVSAFLMALMWFIGVFALMLFIIWVTSRLSFGPRPFPQIIETPAGRGDNAEGSERDFDPPGAEEISELAEPTLQDTITAVTDAASSVAAVAATSDSSGKGDSRPPGPEAEGDDIIPRHERWELQFAAKNAGTYAQMLDFYKIELGAVGGGVQGVDYAANLAGTPRVRQGKSDDEERLYFMWVDRATPLYAFDRQLLQKAGVNISNRELLKFVEPELENMLANIELEYSTKAGHPSVTEIQKTIFQSIPAADGYTFEVLDQRYRKPKK
ncbi:MAG: hypothetical protein EA381_18560 [Planctomycetaceae bacterium]|nr:MAG: hypothetical protein EA381_18560 [Planctomycetaceae bacterium]